MLSQGHMGAPLYHSTSQVSPRSGNSGGHLWSKDAILSCLRLIYIFKIDKPNIQNHSNEVTIPVPPYGGICRIHPKRLQTMASDANLSWAHLVQDTAGMANLTPPTPFPSGIQVTLPNFCFFAHKIIAKWRKRPHPCKTTSQFILIKHSHFKSNHGTAAIHRQHQTVPHHQAIAPTPFLQKLLESSPRYIQSSLSPPPHHPKLTSIIHCKFRSNYGASTIHCPNDPSPPGYCPHFNFCGNRSRTCKDTSNQAQALHHTSQYTHQSNINISEEITVTPPSTNNAK